MKSFPEHNAEWVQSLPYWKKGLLFPNSKPAKREDIESGFGASNETPPEARWFNAMMCENTAAFADIIGHYTGKLYGRERLVAIFKILSRAWQRCTEYGYGSRVWMHSVCAEATA